MSKLFPDKIMLLQACLYTIVGLLTPAATALSKEGPITGRVIAIMVVGGIIGGASGLLAFLSTSYARSRYTVTEKPPIP